VVQGDEGIERQRLHTRSGLAGNNYVEGEGSRGVEEEEPAQWFPLPTIHVQHAGPADAVPILANSPTSYWEKGQHHNEVCDSFTG
jgi:hypothetical protein